MYGHLDKQPEMLGWAEGTGPWQPVVKDGKLYGRGGADDGYAMFASIAALLALKEQGIAHARCRHPDRGVRGIRLARPAFLYRSSGARASARPTWSSAWIPAAAITISFG